MNERTNEIAYFNVRRKTRKTGLIYPTEPRK